MLLKITMTREGSVLSKELIDDGKDRTAYWDQEYKAWAREILADLNSKGESPNAR